MITGVILPDSRIEQMRAAGLWKDRVLAEFLDLAAAGSPERVAIVDPAHRETLTYADLKARADRIAGNLSKLGIGFGDVVSYQVPNWWHAIALHLACVRIGAISNPLMPSLREREIGFILDRAASSIFITTETFRGFDHKAMIESLRPSLPNLKHSVMVGLSRTGGAHLDFDEALLAPAARPATPQAGPDHIVQLLFTSGTTGEPKGVLHTSNTILSHVLAFTERMGLGAEDHVLGATPLAHQMGFLFGVMLPVVLRSKIVLQDVWNAARAVDLIVSEKVRFVMGATPFLADIVNAPDAARVKGILRIFISGGAPIPRELVRRGASDLDLKVMAVYGMTENGCVVTNRLNDPDEKVFGTDGYPMPGMEIRVVDANRNVLGVDQDGHLQCRGPNNFVGYLARPDLYDVDAEGWFSTGDLARIDRDGYVRITGRAKDMIIRGGENIPVVEVESVLLQHPAVERVAVVAMPDARLGERACAFVVPRPGGGFDLAALREFLAEKKMMQTYWPERVELLDKLPMTDSGKVQKVRLREIAKNLTAQ